MTDYTGLGRSELLALLEEKRAATPYLQPDEFVRVPGFEPMTGAELSASLNTLAMLQGSLAEMAGEKETRVAELEARLSDVDAVACDCLARAVKAERALADARTCARALAFCWDHDTRPPEDVLATARQWDARGQPIT